MSVNAATFQMRPNAQGRGVPRELWTGADQLTALGVVTGAPVVGNPVLENLAPSWNLPTTINIPQSGSVGVRQYLTNGAGLTISVTNLPTGVTYNSGTESLEGAASGTSSGTATFTAGSAVDTATVALVEVGSTLVHGELFTITGSGFGVKSPAAPLIWDDCAHGDSITTRWAGRGPSTAPAGYNLDYYTPGQGAVVNVPLPHSNISKVMAGCHYNGGSSTAGYNVGPIAGVPFSNGTPLYVYYLHRASPNFAEMENNYKTWSWDHASANWYGSSTDGYIEWKGTGSHYWKYNAGYSFVSPDARGTTAFDWVATAGINAKTTWASHEWFWGMDTSSNGFCYVVEENKNRTFTELTPPTSGQMRLAGISPQKLSFWYHQRTVPTQSSGTIYAGIGGYAYAADTASWRYFADLYVDTTWSRVVLTNNADYDSSTLVVPQPPVSWSSTSITFTVNKGRLSSGAVHAWVFDADNNRQYAGEFNVN